MSELRFDDRVVVVTGAGRGIGRAHALLLAAKGAQVVVADVGAAADGSGTSLEPANDVVAEIQANGGTAVAVHASVADEAGAASIVSAALDGFGRLDAVINNAGIIAPSTFDAETVEQYRTMFDVHFFGTLFVTQAAWPHLVASGHGRIVNTTSEGMLGIPLSTSYGAAKGAIFGLTRNLDLEGADLGIRANCLAPRADTRMADVFGAALSLPSPAGNRSLPAMPPEQVAPAAAFLAHESCPLNGEVLHVGSGRVARLAVVITKGIAEDELTAEDIAANLDAVMDPTDARIVGLGGPP